MQHEPLTFPPQPQKASTTSSDLAVALLSADPYSKLFYAPQSLCLMFGNAFGSDTPPAWFQEESASESVTMRSDCKTYLLYPF